VNFNHCDESYTFGAAKPIYYDYGHVTTDHTALAINLKSVYIKKKDIPRLEDALVDEADIEEYFEAVEAALDISRFEDDDTRHLSSPESTSQLQIVGEEEQEMDVDMQHHNNNDDSSGENPRKIQPDETESFSE
jgi:hypothetical protein